mgnify:CR=1 FL=1
MKEPKEILIKKEQFIPIIKMFLDDVVKDKKTQKKSMVDFRFSQSRKA